MGNFSEITEAAKSYACSIYRQQPGALVKNPISDVLNLAWDTFCGDAPPPGAGGLPSPPTTPFSGGQCACVNYRVTYSWRNTPTGARSRTGAGNCYGPVTGITVEYPSASSFVIYLIGRGRPPASCVAPGFKASATSGGLSPGIAVYDLQIDSIVRADSQPDTCGNPPAKYPDAPPPPAGGYTSSPTPITFNDNTTKNYYFNFTPPAAPLAPANFIPPIIINYFSATANPEFNIPISFKFDGTISIGGGGGSGGDFNEGDRNTLNDIRNTQNNLGDNITNLGDEVTNITNNYNNKPPTPDDFDPPVENQQPGEYEQSYLFAVQVFLTEVPVNAKTQSGNTASDVLYAGWFEWRCKGYNSPRQPIHFKESIFLAPRGVDGFAYTLYTGFEGRATSIINKEKV